MKLILLVIAIILFILAVLAPYPHLVEIGLAFFAASFLPLPSQP